MGITEENYGAFKKAYNKAKKDEAETFDFEGQEVFTNYAKYVIEYQDSLKPTK